MIANIKERLRQILHLDESPELLAKSFAAGVFVAFTPFMGLHTITALTLAWALRLNKAVTLTGTLVNNPWTIAFIFIGPTWATVAAMRYLGIDVPPLNYEMVSGHFMAVMETYNVWQARFWVEFLREFKPYVHAVLIGTNLAGALAGVVSYFAALSWITFYRKKRERRRMRKAAMDAGAGAVNRDGGGKEQ